MGRYSLLTLALVVASAPASAAPYWISWVGDDWPENQGWTRDILGSGDVRTLADGALTLDGLDTGPGFVWDAYEWFRPGAMDPGPGETFVMQWRLRVDAVTQGNWDPVVWVYSDNSRALHLEFAVSELHSVYEGPGARVAFSPGVFHEYEVRSTDMGSYELFIDGDLRRVGSFGHAVTPSWVGWGDGAGGTRSLSLWDTFSYGVVAEPSCLWLLALGVPAACVRRLR
jgi:hypothetical protein